MESTFSVQDKSVFEILKSEANISPRKRTLLKLHASHEEELHSMINVLKKGTYILPHKHVLINSSGKTIKKGESFLALEGKGKIILFKENGEVEKEIFMDSEEKTMVWVSSEQYHTIVAISDYFIIFENKTGPWKEDEDKFFHEKFPTENELYEQIVRNWEKTS